MKQVLISDDVFAKVSQLAGWIGSVPEFARMDIDFWGIQDIYYGLLHDCGIDFDVWCIDNIKFIDGNLIMTLEEDANQISIQLKRKQIFGRLEGVLPNAPSVKRLVGFIGIDKTDIIMEAMDIDMLHVIGEGGNEY